jgi:D-alanyl-lipoteichoic acid acyltransferase DltB (MBOAT superfamily)
LSDLLSSASLLLAVLGVLYGIWYPEFIEALNVKVPKFTEDRNRPYRRVTSLLYGRAIPLSVASFVVSLIFFPDALKIIGFSIQDYQLNGFAALYDYNAVNTAYCFVIVMSIAIACYITYLSVKLGRLCRRFSSDSKKSD